MDIGLDLFSPKRQASRSGSDGFGAGMDASVKSGSNLFYMPEFGYNRMLNPNMALGVTVYGNGGMNTDYPGGQIGPGTACDQFDAKGGASHNMLCGSGRMGVNLEQLIVAPTFSMKVNDSHSIGVSLLLGYQRFKATGLSSFYFFTPSAANGIPYSDSNLTNRGNDSSIGAGLRIGWQGKVSDTVTLGAAYAMRMRMSKFDKYKDLFAERGGFDLPENWNVCVAFKATPQMTLALDYQRINYGAIKSIANSSRTADDAPPAGPGMPPGGAMNSLGCSSCRGFGWSNVNVVKLGIEYQYTPALTLRAGYNHGANPISSRDVTMNILAPGVVQNHYTLGMSYALSGDSELTVSYMHAATKSVKGASIFNSWLGDNAAETIKMHENSLGIAYSVKFK
jgi:long-chain fatty acid transport protein